MSYCPCQRINGEIVYKKNAQLGKKNSNSKLKKGYVRENIKCPVKSTLYRKEFRKSKELEIYF